MVKAVDAAGSEVRVTLAVEGAGTLTRLSNGGNIMCRRCPIELNGLDGLKIVYLEMARGIRFGRIVLVLRSCLQRAFLASMVECPSQRSQEMYNNHVQ